MNFPYPVQDWLWDFDWIAAKYNELAPAEPIDWGMLTAYFERKYGPDASPHQARLMAAIAYLSQHIEDFNEGLLCIACDGGGMFARPLILALRVICTRVNEHELGVDWPVLDIKLMAEAIARFPTEASKL